MKTLRPYQDASIKSLFNWLFTEGTGHPLVVAPVGSGKSLMIAEFIRQVHGLYPRTRIIVLTHVKELLVQNAEELRGQYPDCDFGFYCASLEEKRLHNDVTFASIQSIKNKAGYLNRAPEIIIVDECHLISHKDTTSYRKFFDAVLAINPNCKILGFTGTPFRADSGRLDEGEGALFDGVAYEIPMGYMIDEGYWAKPVTPALSTKMDVSGVSVRGGDYVIGQLEERINTVELRESCVKELILHGQGRKKWLVFTAAVQHCTDVYNDLCAIGIRCGMVTGETNQDERDKTIEAFKRGDLQCLVNVAVLTTGFNVPDVDLLAFMRPTRSPVLYIQTTGRGVRPVYAPGFDLSTKEGRLAAIAASEKPDCLILDFGGVVETLGPIDQVSIRKKFTGEKEKDGKSEPVTKICPSCGAECAAAQRYCYACSYCFIELDRSPAENAVVSADEPPEWYDVVAMTTAKHVKKSDPDAKPTMRVSYATFEKQFKEWICFEHQGYAWEKAKKWHYDRSMELLPTTIDDALKITYPAPKRILVRREGKYDRIIDWDFSKETAKDEREAEGFDGFEIPF